MPPSKQSRSKSSASNEPIQAHAQTQQGGDKSVGYVLLLGRPNSGKSTFLNALLHDQISIVSNVPQTTQRPIRGIYTDDDMQIIFLDVPGFHESTRGWNQQLNNVVRRSLDECDVILRLIDSTRAEGKEEMLLDEMLLQTKKPIVTAYSKVDILKDRSVLPKGCMILSSKTEEGIPEILTELKTHISQGPELYPADDITDQHVYTRITEIVREQICLLYRQEIPHCVYVEVDRFQKSPQIIRIEAVIYCESDSQKKILIGKKGSCMKTVGIGARRKLEKLFATHVYLGLQVKVHPRWRQSREVTSKILT